MSKIIDVAGFSISLRRVQLVEPVNEAGYYWVILVSGVRVQCCDAGMPRAMLIEAWRRVEDGDE